MKYISRNVLVIFTLSYAVRLLIGDAQATGFDVGFFACLLYWAICEKLDEMK